MKKQKETFQVCYYYEGIDSLTEHHFLSMVDNLSKLTASNRYISQYLFTTKKYISTLVKKLEENGYINVTLVANQYRTITLTDKCVKMIFPPIQSTKEVVLSTTPPPTESDPPSHLVGPPSHKVGPPLLLSGTNNIVDNIEIKKDNNIEYTIGKVEEVVEDITFDNSSPTKTLNNEQRLKELVSETESPYLKSLIKE